MIARDSPRVKVYPNSPRSGTASAGANLSTAWSNRIGRPVLSFYGADTYIRNWLRHFQAVSQDLLRRLECPESPVIPSPGLLPHQRVWRTDTAFRIDERLGMNRRNGVRAAAARACAASVFTGGVAFDEQIPKFPSRGTAESNSQSFQACYAKPLPSTNNLLCRGELIRGSVVALPSLGQFFLDGWCERV